MIKSVRIRQVHTDSLSCEPILRRTENGELLCVCQCDGTYIEKGTYTGNFSTGVTITWSHGEWTEKFTHKSGNIATLIDGSGWDWEYKVCDVEKAQKVLDGLS